MGAIWISRPSNGIQNGAPDSLALVNGAGAVIQFLSYEGVISGADIGSETGLTSTDIGVSQASSTVGTSLQLTGTGKNYEDFTWAADLATTSGAVNTTQTFSAGGGGADTDPPVWATDYPAIVNIVDTQIDIALKMDEPGTVYYLVMEVPHTAPTNAEVRLYFNETIYAGTGYVVIIDEAGTYYDSIMVSGTSVETSYWAANVTPTKDLMVGTKYSVLVDSAAFIDFQGNAWEGISSDTVWTFTTVAPIEVANLAALRGGLQDNKTIYKVTGEVLLNYQQDYFNKKYIEDATGGIEIHDPDGMITTTYAIGDGITGLTGTLDDYFNLMQFVPVADPGAASSTGNTLTPQTISISEFNTNFEDYEIELVRIDTVTFADAGAKFANDKEYNVSQGTDVGIVRVHFFESGLSGTDIQGVANVTGIATWHFSEPKIGPRSLQDVVEVVIIPDNIGDILSEDNIRVYPNPSSGLITMELKMVGTADLDVEIYSMNGKVVYRNTFNSVSNVHEQIDLSNMARGMYMLSVRSNEGVSRSKFVIR